MSADWLPSYYEYALAHPCYTCGAKPGVDCDAPRKRSEPDPVNRQHKSRFAAADRHYWRDYGNAPWPEDRVPGVRYDTLPEVPR